jgi:hypothetical protein
VGSTYISGSLACMPPCFVLKKHPNVLKNFQQKYKWMDDEKFFVHIKFEMQQNLCRDIKKVKSAL